MNQPAINTAQLLNSYRAPPPSQPVMNFANQGGAPFGYPPNYQPEILVPTPMQTSPGVNQPVYHVKVTATPVSMPPHVTNPQYMVSTTQGVSAANRAYAGAGEQVVGHVQSELPDGMRHLGVSVYPLQGSSPSSTNRSEFQGEAGAALYMYPGTEPAGLADLSRRYGEAEVVHSQQAGPMDGRQLSPEDYTRILPHTADLQDNGESRPKMYSWILPAGSDVQESSSDPIASKQFSSGEMDVEQAFMDLKQKEEKDPLPDTLIVSSRTDEQLGLPMQLRPSVHYAGMEHSPPELAGSKAALKYKLHAIEVHQYIPLPDVPKPWILENNVNPANTAIFGAMPLPFDPIHSGMVAPLFQRTHHNQHVPTLSPELVAMFHHELPVSSVGGLELLRPPTLPGSNTQEGIAIGE